MCSIVGLVKKEGAGVGRTLKAMLEQTRHRGPDGAGVALGLEVERAADVAALSGDQGRGCVGLGHSRLRITGETGIQPLTGCGRGLVLAFNGEIWRHRKLRQRLEARGHVFETDSDSEVLIHELEERLSGEADPVAAVARLLEELDGEYAFALHDARRNDFLLARDIVGVKQLYYGETDRHLAFCSEKKPLWELSIAPRRVLPGQVVRLAADGPDGGWRFAPGERVELSPPEASEEIHGEQEALGRYWSALVEAVSKRVEGHSRIGVIFSGGVDSVLVARLAQRLGVQVHCYASGLPDSQDVEEARNAAEALDLPLTVAELDDARIQEELPSILTAIESANHLQVDVAIPIYFAVQEAARDGLRVLLTGQGADELFAGYPWYPEILAATGETGLRRSLQDDLGNLYKDTLEREDKITMFHSIELRVPYLDPRVIRIAMRLAPALKIREDELKYLHRRLAEEAGVPSRIAWRPKEAAQHGSRVHETLKSVLVGLGRDLSLSTGDHRPAGSREVSEELGSAYRYGGDAYAGNEGYQIVLDHLGRQLGLA